MNRKMKQQAKKGTDFKFCKAMPVSTLAYGTGTWITKIRKFNITNLAMMQNFVYI
jgi:hypothetical protein